MTNTSQNPLRPADVRIVDLFAGPGGLDMAAHALGAASIGIEWDASACETRREAGLPTEQGDVRAFDAAKFPEANVLAGGPPCQTYTVAGKGAGRRALDEVLGFVERLANGEAWPYIEADLAVLEDERTGLVLQPLHWALDALLNGSPYEAIVLEQVPAVLPVWTAFRDVLHEKGYSAECGILRTEEYGVPQTRRRAVLIARYGKKNKVALPSPTHQPYRKDIRPTLTPTPPDPCLWQEQTDGRDGPPLPWVSMGEALADHRTGPFTVISNYGTGGIPRHVAAEALAPPPRRSREKCPGTESSPGKAAPIFPASASGKQACCSPSRKNTPGPGRTYLSRSATPFHRSWACTS